MKGLLFIGEHEEFTRSINPVDESLMRRIMEARQRFAFLSGGSGYLSI